MQFKMSIFKWYSLVSQLKKRGGGVRESGAFLLVKNGTNKICDVLYYDDLDPSCLNEGYVKFTNKGQLKRDQILIQRQLIVAADIHTHPGTNTSQSEADRLHPMVRIKGHIALIAPGYAQRKYLMPGSCSAYQYEGSFQWRVLRDPFPIKLTLL